MLPVLFSIGNLSVSSFGVFLTMGLLLGIFLVWRLCRAWDLDEEKILDITLVTFMGGLIGARLYFVISHLQLFMASPLNLILINKFPGFSLWGGILGGWLMLFFFTRRKRLDFWQLADIASVGLIGGMILSSLGCFLGGCSVGVPSKEFFAVTMLGSVGKRWPIQIVEAFILAISLRHIWSKAVHFHQKGKIVSLGFIYIGFTKLILEPFKVDHSGAFFSVVFVILGLTIFYKITKQNPLMHAKNVLRSFTMQNFKKSWYNQKTSIGWKLRSLKKVLRRSNVKFS